MTSFLSKSTHTTIRWAALLTALTVTITGLLQVLNLQLAFASYTNTYPWGNALCAWTGSQTGSCSDYDWGYTTCPSGDNFCTSQNQINGYYQLDQFGYGFRNCVSYAAWQIKQVFNITIPSNWGNGSTWDTNALNAGYHNDSSPQVGDIAQWNATPQNQWGHVAYVYAVSNGIASYAEYNYAGDGNYLDTYTSASNSQGPPNNYIHIGTVTPPNPGLGGGNASTWASGRLDAWIEQSSPTNGSNLGHIWFNGAWQPWGTIGAPNNELMASQPAAVSWSYGTTPNRIDVFAQGQSNDLIQTYYDGTSWHQWYSLQRGAQRLSRICLFLSWAERYPQCWNHPCAS
jgi:surface antigen